MAACRAVVGSGAEPLVLHREIFANGCERRDNQFVHYLKHRAQKLAEQLGSEECEVREVLSIIDAIKAGKHVP